MENSNFSSARELVLGFPQVVAERIEDAIFSGELKPGQHLSQDKLAEAFGVSRIPMRDALTILETKGLVTLDYRRRASVRVVTQSLLRETYGIRLVLEPYASQLAIEQMTLGEVEMVVRLCERMEQFADDPDSGRKSRREFYEAFYLITGSKILVEMILKLRKMVEPYHIIRPAHKESHADLKDLIQSRDARGAARWMTGHLQTALQSQLKELEISSSRVK